MEALSRRALFRRTGAIAAVAGAATVASSVGRGSGAAPSANAATGDDYDGVIHDQGGQVFDIKSAAYGALGDAVMVAAAAAIAAGSTSLTWTGGRFTAADAGKVVTVQGAGANGTVLSTTVSSVASPTQATLAAP